MIPLRALPLLLLCCLLALPRPVLAEGPLSGGTRLYIEDEPLGPFTVSSFAAPNPPVTTDNLWVTAQVRDGARAVLDARVWITVTPLGGGAPERAEARHELAAQPLDYTAFLPVPAEGLYHVLIEMEHPQGNGTASYDVNVSEPLTRWIILLLGLPFGLAALWVARRMGRRLPASARVLSGDDAPLSSREALKE